MKQKELITYQIVDVFPNDKEYQQKDYSSDKDASCLAIELRGKDLLSLGRAFAFFRKFVQEIIHRETASSEAFIIFSTLEQENFLRAKDIIRPISWSEEKLEEFSKNQGQDVSLDLSLDLSDAFPKSEKLEDSLSKIYSFNPKKNIISLSGEANPSAFLLLLNWLLTGPAKKISYDNRTIR